MFKPLRQLFGHAKSVSRTLRPIVSPLDQSLKAVGMNPGPHDQHRSLTTGLAAAPLPKLGKIINSLVPQKIIPSRHVQRRHQRHLKAFDPADGTQVLIIIDIFQKIPVELQFRNTLHISRRHILHGEPRYLLIHVGSIILHLSYGLRRILPGIIPLPLQRPSRDPSEQHR